MCILVPLIEEKPWLRQNHKGEREVWEGTKWQTVDKNDYSKIPKMEVTGILLRREKGKRSDLGLGGRIYF